VRGGCYRSLGTSAYVQPSRAHLSSFHLFMGLLSKTWNVEGKRKKPIKNLAMAFSVIFRDQPRPIIPYEHRLVKLLVFPNDIGYRPPPRRLRARRGGAPPISRAAARSARCIPYFAPSVHTQSRRVSQLTHPIAQNHSQRAERIIVR